MTGSDDDDSTLRIPKAELDQSRREGKDVKCVMLRDHVTKCLFGHVIPLKGTDDNKYATTISKDMLPWLGRTRVSLTCDNEASKCFQMFPDASRCL